MKLVAYYSAGYDEFAGKFLNALVRYRRDELLGVLAFDPSPSLRTYAEGRGLPVFGDPFSCPQANVCLVITTMRLPTGRELASLLNAVRLFVSIGGRIQNGTHESLGALIPECAASIEELRVSNSPARLYSDKLCRRTGQLRVLTVGLDSNIGKMTAALEITAVLRRRGMPCRFVATGQIGIALSGTGVPLDSCVADFLSGHLESHLLSLGEEILIIEGQGSLYNPLFSSVSLGQIHGSVPHLLVVCGDAARRSPRGASSLALPSYPEAIVTFERMARIVSPLACVIGVSVNTSSLSEDAARDHLEQLCKEVRLPTTDVVRFGAEPLVVPIQSKYRELV